VLFRRDPRASCLGLVYRQPLAVRGQESFQVGVDKRQV
jgi:hypothetical protein